MTPSVNEANKELISLLKRHKSPEKLHDFVNEEMTTRGGAFTRGGMPVYVKPYFIDMNLATLIKKGSEKLITAINKVLDLFYDDPEIYGLFKLTNEERELTEIDPGFPVTVQVSRNDAFISSNNVHFLEVNADSPVGVMYTDIHTGIIEGLPFWEEMKSRFDIESEIIMPRLLSTLINAYRAAGGKKDKPVITLSAGKGSGTKPEFMAITDYFQAAGFTTVYNELWNWEYDGKNLIAPDGTKPDMIYRRGTISDWIEFADEIKPVIKALKDKNVVMVNPFRSKMASQKSILHILQLEKIQKALSAEECRFIAKTIPWTRIMTETMCLYDGRTIDLYPYIRKNRSEFVLKPVNSFGGKDVCIGREAAESEWDAALEQTKKFDFVVQKYIETPEEIFPIPEPRMSMKAKKINANFYVCGGDYAGGVARTSDSSIINVSRGGGMTTIMFVKKKENRD